MKKGMMFSISIFILLSSLLYLAISFSNYMTSLKQSTTTLSTVETMVADADAVEYGLKRITEQNGLNTTVISSSNVSFSQNTSYFTRYAEQITSFSSFISNYGAKNASIKSSAVNVSALINPHNITVSSVYGNFTVLALAGENSSGKITSYEVAIKAAVSTPRFNWTDYYGLPSSDPSAIRVRVAFQGSNGTTYDERYLDRAYTSRVQLLNQQNKSMVTISMFVPSGLWLNYSLDMYLNVIVGLNNVTKIESREELVTVDLGEKAKIKSKVIFVEG